MKKFVKAAICAAVVAASPSAFAIPMGTVGGLDSFKVGASLPNSGLATEEAWVESVLGFDVVFSDKLESDLGELTFELVDGTTDVYAQLFSGQTDYFIVKTGRGSSTGNTHFLFDNEFNLSYGVIDLSDLGFSSNVTIQKVSHVTAFFEDQPSPVPEPTAAALLGLGLAGLGVANRRRRKI